MRTIFVVAVGLLCGIAVIASVFLVPSCGPHVKYQLVAIGTKKPIDAAMLQAWSGKATPSILYETADKRAIALRLTSADADRALSFAKNDSNVRYAYFIDNLDALIATELPDTELSTNDRGELKHSRATQDVDNAHPLKLQAPLFQFDVLRNELALGHSASEKLTLGNSTRLSIDQLLSAAMDDPIKLRVEANDGRQGVVVIGSVNDELYLEGQLTGSPISLHLLSGSKYQLVERDRNRVPGDPTPTSRENRGVSRWEEVRLRADVAAIPAHQKIKLGLWITDGALEYLNTHCQSAEDSAAANASCPKMDEATLLRTLKGNLSSFDEAFSQSGDPGRGIDLELFHVGTQWPDSQDAQSLLSELCRPRHRSERSRILHQQAVDRGVDVKALVLWNLCDTEDQDDQREELCGSYAPKVKMCRNDATYLHAASPEKLEGLAAQISTHDPDHAVLVVDARYLLDGTVHHELGHLLGGQHGIGGQPDLELAPISARAFMLNDPNVGRPMLTLMASKLECPDGNCIWLPQYSTPKHTALKITPKRGQPQPVQVGDEYHNNDEVIEQNFHRVAAFATWRRMLCEGEIKYSAAPLLIPFSFNRPIVGQGVLPKRIKASRVRADRLIDQQRAWLQEYIEDCPAPYLRVSGHTDSIKGPYSNYNDDLARERAALVVGELVSRLGGEITVCQPPTSFGERVPRVRKQGAAAQSKNRRVEVSFSMVPCS